MTFLGLKRTSWVGGHYGIAQSNQSIGSPSWPHVPLVQYKSAPLETYNSLGSSALDLVLRVGFKASGASGGYASAPFWDCHGGTECAALQGRAGYNCFSTSHPWWRGSVLALSVSRSLLHNKQIPPTLGVFPLLTERGETRRRLPNLWLSSPSPKAQAVTWILWKCCDKYCHTLGLQVRSSVRSQPLSVQADFPPGSSPTPHI